MLGVTPHELTCIPSKGNVSIPVLYAIKSMELACASSVVLGVLCMAHTWIYHEVHKYDSS